MMCIQGSSIPQLSRKRKYEAEDATLYLADDEHHWAKKLKEARNHIEKDPVSDLAYAQHAIESLSTTSKQEALLKIQAMVDFRSKFDVQDTAEDAMERLKDLMVLCPDLVLRIDQCGDSKQGSRYFVVLDFAELIKGVKGCAKAEEDRKTLMAGLFYLSHCLFPHVSAMRGGVTLIFECEDVDWNHLETADDGISSLWKDLHNFYPMAFRDAWFYNTTEQGVKILTLSGLRALSEETMNRIYLGCQLPLVGNERVTLRDLFRKNGNGHRPVLEDMKTLISLRYQNDAAFYL